MCDAWNLTGDQQALAGEWNAGDTASLITRCFPDQQLPRLDLQMRRQPRAASTRPVPTAIIPVAIGPGIEYVRGAVTLQQSQKLTDVRCHGLRRLLSH